MRSEDRGETWSRPFRILDFDATTPKSLGNGVGDPCIVVDRERGTIFVAALWSPGQCQEGSARRTPFTLAATRDLLLPKLMSGELRVRDAEAAMADIA